MSTVTTEAAHLRLVAPATPGAKRWTITTTDGTTVTGHLPDWAVEDPSRTEVPLDELPFVLRDILHWTVVAGLPLTPTHDTGPNTPTDGIITDDGVFLSTIEYRPYPDQPHQPLPTAGFQLTDHCWLTDLDPDALTHLATQLRTQADHLDHTVRPALTAARQDWASHHNAASIVQLMELNPSPATHASRPRTRPARLYQEPEAVTWARQKAGLTKRALAEQISISEQLMGEIESGWRSATPANLAKIAEALKCPIVALEHKHPDRRTST